MNKEKMLNKIKELKAQIEVLERLANEPENKRRRPDKNEEYYIVDAQGTIFSSYNGFHRVDLARFEIGNYFKTKEEAEFMVEKLKVIEELKEFAYEFSDVEWKDDDVFKFYFYYDYDNNKIDIDYDLVFKRKYIYFKTKEDAEKAIEKVGKDRIKKYYFGVGE